MTLAVYRSLLWPKLVIPSVPPEPMQLAGLLLEKTTEQVNDAEAEKLLPKERKALIVRP